MTLVTVEFHFLEKEGVLAQTVKSNLHSFKNTAL